MSSGKKILICRSPDSGEPAPCTTSYVIPTHSHRGSCPASPGKSGSGCDGRGRGWLSAARAAQPRSSPNVPTGRAELAGRGRSRRRGHRLRPAGPLHRRCAREGHAGRHAPRPWCWPTPMSSCLRQSRKGAGGRGADPLYSDLLDPARLNLAAVGVHSGLRDVFRPPTGSASATHRLVGATY